MHVNLFPAKFKSFILIVIIFGVFILINTGLAATCTQKYSGYGQCAADCATLSGDFQKDTSNDAGLCTDTLESCCYKTGGSPAGNDSLLENLKLQVPIFDVTNVDNLPQYIATLYRYILIILVPLAIVMVIVGGISWITAAGDQGKIGNAKKYITSAFSGLIIGLFSYVLLSLVGINALTIPNIQSIERVEGGDLIIIDGVAYSQAEANERLPAGRKGSAESYQNMACPTKDTTTFKVYFTNYYSPAYNEAGGYDSFWCNVGMQCSCPKGASSAKTCRAGSYSWGPCNYFPSSYRPEIDYCNKAGGTVRPTGGYTIAADIPRKGRANACFKKGCKLTIEGSNAVHEVQDTGSTQKIIGLHMDYYAGIGLAGKNPPSGVYTVTITNPDFCLK